MSVEINDLSIRLIRDALKRIQQHSKALVEITRLARAIPEHAHTHWPGYRDILPRSAELVDARRQHLVLVIARRRRRDHPPIDVPPPPIRARRLRKREH